MVRIGPFWQGVLVAIVLRREPAQRLLRQQRQAFRKELRLLVVGVDVPDQRCQLREGRRVLALRSFKNRPHQLDRQVDLGG